MREATEAVIPIELIGDDYLPQPFDAFMRAEYRGALAFARAVTHGWDEADDLCQEAFLAAYRRWDEIGRYQEPAGFVRRVIANRSVSGVRKRVAEAAALERIARRRPLDASGPQPDFWGAVGRLPIRQRHVVALHYLEDRSVRDIAEVLEIAEGTVKAHLHAARRALAQLLRAELDQEDER